MKGCDIAMFRMSSLLVPLIMGFSLPPCYEKTNTILGCLLEGGGGTTDIDVDNKSATKVIR